MNAGPGRRRSPAIAVAAVLLVAVLVAACGPEPAPSPGPTATLRPLPTSTTSTFALGVSAWYAGLILHFERASAVLDEAGGSVAVDLRIENPGPDLASLTAPFVLASGVQAVEPVRQTVLPDVASGGTTATTVVFDVEGTFDVSIAAIRVGRTAEHQVVVPLVAHPGSLEVLEPRTLAIGGTGNAGSLTVKLTGGELRADLPDWGMELPRGTLALTLTYDATFRSTFPGGFPFTSATHQPRAPGRTIDRSAERRP